MTPMRKSEIPDEFTKLIDECTSLINTSGAVEVQQRPYAAESLPSLLEQCRAILNQDHQVQEPVRIIHHFACTGGTLFSKCLASMPNVQLLSEVAPYSLMTSPERSKFSPTDLIQLLRSSSRGSHEELERELFRSGIEKIYEDCQRRGLRLVIREHSHSKYCVGDQVLSADGIAKLLDSDFPVRAVVTVRHPLDSYLSLRNHGWLKMQSATLEEYARRYLVFLADHCEKPRFRYEELIAKPVETSRRICAELQIPFSDGFIDMISVHRLSGDSGRSSAKIGQRLRRHVPEDVKEELSSATYCELCDVLGYPID